MAFDPDSQVRETIAYFFETFSRVGSASQTVKVFRKEGICFPSRIRNQAPTIFQPLTISTAIRTLNNPRYSLFDLFADHEIGRELKAMSQWLDEHRELIGLAAEDLRRHGVKETGREGLPAESVLRCAILKQHRQLSYEELAFHLEDSASFRAFARLPLSWTPKKSVLHRTISAIRAETWEAINRALLASAGQEKIETGTVVRFDSTVTAALMHEPSDSSLLWDGVRVLARLLQAADALVGGLQWRDHRRAAKKRARTIEYARDRLKRTRNYRELLKLTRSTLAYADQAAAQLGRAADPIAATLWQAEFRHYRPLIERIIAQTERRVLHGEAVPANEKIVSLFEPHADIIVKGGRDVQYGHKLNLATGRSGLILDLVIEPGNPADSDRFLPMLERHIAFYGEAPDRRPPMAVSPAATISPRRRPSASMTRLSTRKPACASWTWSKATGSIASCATSGPA